MRINNKNGIWRQAVGVRNKSRQLLFFSTPHYCQAVWATLIDYPVSINCRLLYQFEYIYLTSTKAIYSLAATVNFPVLGPACCPVRERIFWMFWPSYMCRLWRLEKGRTTEMILDCIRARKKEEMSFSSVIFVDYLTSWKWGESRGEKGIISSILFHLPRRLRQTHQAKLFRMCLYPHLLLYTFCKC